LHLAINVDPGDKVEPDYAAIFKVNYQLGMAQKNGAKEVLESLMHVIK